MGVEYQQTYNNFFFFNCKYFSEQADNESDVLIFETAMEQFNGTNATYRFNFYPMTGSDTTSVIFKMSSKKTVFKLLEKRYELIACAEVFTKIDSPSDVILANEILLFP